MLFQEIMDYSAIYWIVGLGLTVALAFALNYLLSGNNKTIFVFVLFFDALFVWAGILPVWSLIACLIISFTVTYYTRSSEHNSGFLIGLCLGILLVLTFLSVISGNSFVSFTTGGVVDITFLTNGTVSSTDVLNQSVVFVIDDLVGALSILVAIGTVIGLIGLHIFGAGLSDVSVSTMRTVLIYGGIWGLLSVLIYNLIVSIAIFGFLFYIGLTLFYVIGVFKKMGEHA